MPGHYGKKTGAKKMGTRKGPLTQMTVAMTRKKNGTKAKGVQTDGDRARMGMGRKKRR